METTHQTLLDLPTPMSKGNCLTQNPISTESIAETQRLLDQAIAHAWRTVKTDRRPPKLTPIRWVWRLAAFYHLCASTPQLMKEAAQHFSASGRKSLAQWAMHKAEEEAGHDRLALLDIQSMGYRPETVVEKLFPPAAKALLNYFSQSAQNSDPIDCVGYSYTAERLGICIGQAYIQKVEALLPPNMNATRCLRAHSAISSTEVKHVKETLAMIAGLSLQERNNIAQACYKAACLRFSPPKGAYLSDEEIYNVLKQLRLTNKHE
jgi:pyrroloquinoline quinone (PQQ) biosynthesis protein C